MRKLPAILIVVFLVFPLFLAALYTIAISTWVLDRELYVRVLSDIRLYEIPRTSNMNRIWIWPWTAEAWGFPAPAYFALREVATPDYMKTQALAVFQDAWDFIMGRSARFGSAIDLTPIKKSLAGEGGKRYAQALAASLPVGPAGGSFSLTATRLPNYRPSNITVPQAAKIIEKSLPTIIKSIPDRVDIGDRPWGASLRWSLPSALGALIAADVILLFLSCGLWFLAAFIASDRMRGRLIWLGWSLFAPAVLVFLTGIFVNIGFIGNVVRFGIGSAGLESIGFSKSFVSAVYQAASTLMSRIATGFIATGAIAGGISLGLVAWGWAGAHDPREKPQETPAQ
jgi:hypothetical protein